MNKEIKTIKTQVLKLICKVQMWNQLLKEKRVNKFQILMKLLLLMFSLKILVLCSKKTDTKNKTKKNNKYKA